MKRLCNVGFHHHMMRYKLMFAQWGLTLYIYVHISFVRICAVLVKDTNHVLPFMIILHQQDFVHVHLFMSYGNPKLFSSTSCV